MGDRFGTMKKWLIVLWWFLVARWRQRPKPLTQEELDRLLAIHFRDHLLLLRRMTEIDEIPGLYRADNHAMHLKAYQDEINRKSEPFVT